MFNNDIHHDHDRRRHRRDPRSGHDGRGFGFRGPFGGGPGRGGMVRRGEIRPLILAVLAAKPTHGYEIITELQAQSGGRWRPSAGSVYPTLQQLADEGPVTSQDGHRGRGHHPTGQGPPAGGARAYTLTDEGRSAAAAGPGVAWNETGRSRGTDVRHLARQVVEAAVQVQRVGTPEAAIAARDILIETRAKLYGLLATDAVVPDDAPDDDGRERV